MWAVRRALAVHEDVTRAWHSLRLFGPRLSPGRAAGDLARDCLDWVTAAMNLKARPSSYVINKEVLTIFHEELNLKSLRSGKSAPLGDY